MTKSDVYKIIGMPSYIDPEAGYEFWSRGKLNGRWDLSIRFNDERIGVGQITFRNEFYDSDYNPLPRPYLLANFTTKSIQ